MSRWVSVAGEVWAGISTAILLLMFVAFGISFWRRELGNTLLRLLVFLQVIVFIPYAVYATIRLLPLLITVMLIFTAGLFLLLGFAWVRGIIQRRANGTTDERRLTDAT